MGSVMKSDIVNHLADEQYVVRVDDPVSRTIAVSSMCERKPISARSASAA